MDTTIVPWPFDPRSWPTIPG